MRKIAFIVFFSAVFFGTVNLVNSSILPADLNLNGSHSRSSMAAEGLDYWVENIERGGVHLATVTTIQNNNCQYNSIFRGHDGRLFSCCSVFADVMNGPVEMDFMAYDGTLATVIVNAGNGIGFEPDSFTISSPISNSDGVIVVIDGVRFFVPPGQSNQIVRIDIQPSIKPDSYQQRRDGQIPVVIFGSPYLDVGSIEVNSLVLNDLAGKMEGHSDKLAVIDHVNDDEYPDLVVNFENHSSGLHSGFGYATVKGQLSNGTTISGRDYILITP